MSFLFRLVEIFDHRSFEELLGVGTNIGTDSGPFHHSHLTDIEKWVRDQVTELFIYISSINKLNSQILHIREHHHRRALRVDLELDQEGRPGDQTLSEQTSLGRFDLYEGRANSVSAEQN